MLDDTLKAQLQAYLGKLQRPIRLIACTCGDYLAHAHLLAWKLLEGLCQELPPLLDYLERVVPDENEGFLVGDTITVADLAVARHHANRTTIKGGYGQKPVSAADVHHIAAFGFAEFSAIAFFN